MKENNQIYTDEFFVKKFDKKYSTTEYNLGDNRFINIIINQSNENLNDVYKYIIDFLLESEFQIINQFFFGNDVSFEENKNMAEKYFKKISWPVTSIKQKGGKWGTIITGIKSKDLRTIFHDDLVIGKIFSDKYSDYCYLGALMPKSKILPKDLSTKSIFQFIETELEKVNMNFKNIIRTWFYLDELLNWYDEFNEVRNDYFEERNIYRNLIPASTGIGAKNFSNSLLQSAAIAIKPNSENVKVISIDSPLQCPASEYKSSFSRAVEIDHPDYRQLIISGTASINAEGETENKDNIYDQIKLTMDVINGILRSRNLTLQDVIKGIVYFKDLSYINDFNNYCNDNNISKLPLAMLQADICRDELLFEIELDAIEIKNRY